MFKLKFIANNKITHINFKGVIFMKTIISAIFCVLILSVTLTGCGSKVGKDISSDISSMMPDMDNSSNHSNGSNSMQYSSDNSSNNNSSNGTNSYSSDDIKISKEKAKEIVLNHAKLKDTDIKDYEIDLDYENGNLIYEISFKDKTHEYDYDIDAKTGDIRHSDKEVKD